MVSSGHICQFEDMQVTSVLLDEIMKDPENPLDDLLLHLDIKVMSPSPYPTQNTPGSLSPAPGPTLPHHSP